MLTSNFVLLRTEKGIRPFYYSFESNKVECYSNLCTIQNFLDIEPEPNVLYPLTIIPQDINIIYLHQFNQYFFVMLGDDGYIYVFNSGFLDKYFIGYYYIQAYLYCSGPLQILLVDNNNELYMYSIHDNKIVKIEITNKFEKIFCLNALNVFNKFAFATKNEIVEVDIEIGSTESIRVENDIKCLSKYYAPRDNHENNIIVYVTTNNILYVKDYNFEILKKYENIKSITRISNYFSIFIITLNGTAINKSKEIIQESWIDKYVNRQDPEVLSIINENIVEIISRDNNIIIVTNSGNLYSYDIKNKSYDLMKRSDNLDVLYAGYVPVRIKST